MSDHKRLYATIFLPYFKQGDDLNGCIVKDENEVVDTKATLRNHMAQLEAAIAELKEIHDTIPDVNTCVIDGDTHHIGIEGDERIINALVSKELAQIDEDYNEENNNESSSGSNSDEDSNGSDSKGNSDEDSNGSDSGESSNSDESSTDSDTYEELVE